MCQIPIHRQKLQASDFAHELRSYKWAKRFNEANGLFYNEDLAGRGGINACLYIPPGTPEEVISGAMDKILAQRDVVSFTLLEISQEFIWEAYP